MVHRDGFDRSIVMDGASVHRRIASSELRRLLPLDVNLGPWQEVIDGASINANRTIHGSGSERCTRSIALPNPMPDPGWPRTTCSKPDSDEAPERFIRMTDPASSSVRCSDILLRKLDRFLALA